MPQRIIQTPEQLARDRIDTMLTEAGWVVQSKQNVDLFANRGIAIREYQTDVGPADYIFIHKSCNVISPLKFSG